MALGTAAAIGLGLAGIGGIMNARSQNKAAQQQTKYNNQTRGMILGQMQQGPSAIEQYGMGMLGMGGTGGRTPFSPPSMLPSPRGLSFPGGPMIGRSPAAGSLDGFTGPTQGLAGGGMNGAFSPMQVQMPGAYSPQMVSAPADYNFERVAAPADYQFERVAAPDWNPEMANVASYLGAQGFNTGQDALMQMLRSDPRSKVDQTLEGIAHGNGDPFDTSGMFSALEAVNSRRIGEEVGALRAGASGLGQRFGSAMMRNEGDVRAQMLENEMLQRAQIQMSSYEQARGRQMQGLGMLTGREQFNTGMQAQLGQAVQQGGLNAAGLQMQGVGMNNNAMQARNAMILQAAMANQGAGLNAANMNRSYSMQAALANQGAGLNAANMNRGFSMQAALANQGAGLNAAQLNQQGLMQGQGLQLQANQLAQSGQMDMMQMLLAAQNARTGSNAGLVGATAGMGPVAGPGYGGVIGGLGSGLIIASGMPQQRVR